MNGALNFSILDGWWNEGFNMENGWAFGDTENYNTLEEWDSWDSDELYDILEKYFQFLRLKKVTLPSRLQNRPLTAIKFYFLTCHLFLIVQNIQT